MGRTRLTTPPGQEPEGPEQGPDELYVPGLERPTEPRVPGRHRRKLIALLLLLVVGIGGYVAWRVATAGQFFDPALTDLTPGEPTETPTGTTPNTPTPPSPTTGGATP